MRAGLQCLTSRCMAGAGASTGHLSLLEDVGAGAALCHAHAARLLQIVGGDQHPMAQSNAFCAFFAGLPYNVASVITRLSQQLCV